jgi:predicted aspartyl protease
MRKRVGLFHYPVELADKNGENFEERRPLVDTGALYSQFPASMLERLGHQSNATRRFRLADETVIERPIGDVIVRIGGETRTSVCVFGGEASPELLGAVTMELFSLAPDPVNETLIPVIASLMTDAY